MTNPYQRTILFVAISALLAHSSPASESAKSKATAAASALKEAVAQAVAERRAHSLINEGCMNNEEVRAVAAVFAARQQRQDEETKEYEIFKFNRQLLIAHASAPTIVIENGATLGDAEAPASYSDATGGRLSARSRSRLTAIARAALRDDMEASEHEEGSPSRVTVRDHVAEPDRENAHRPNIVRGSEAARGTEAAPDQESDGTAAQVVTNPAVRELRAYPAKYFRKLAMEKDLAEQADAKARKEMFEAMVGEQKQPLLLETADAPESQSTSNDSGTAGQKGSWRHR